MQNSLPSGSAITTQPRPFGRVRSVRIDLLGAGAAGGARVEVDAVLRRLSLLDSDAQWEQASDKTLFRVVGDADQPGARGVGEHLGRFVGAHRAVFALGEEGRAGDAGPLLPVGRGGQFGDRGDDGGAVPGRVPAVVPPDQGPRPCLVAQDGLRLRKRLEGGRPAVRPGRGLCGEVRARAGRAASIRIRIRELTR